MGTSTELYQSTNDLLYQPIVSFILWIRFYKLIPESVSEDDGLGEMLVCAIWGLDPSRDSP